MAYDEGFYARRRALSHASAAAVLGELLAVLRPQSMLDIGCGTGSWLAVAGQLGVPKRFGIDGGSVPAHLLEIPQDCFLASDLNQPLPVAGRFDLALCMEVAEHLRPERAESLVAEIVRSADCVLFGAAIPRQIGTHHINCQWQSYWRGLFSQHGYVRLGFMQERFWHDRRINVVYRQNTGLYVHRDRFNEPAWADKLAQLGRQDGLIDVVHPELYELYLDQLRHRLAA